MRVLTVCTHNRTRSVVAAALLGHHLQRHGVECETASAGVVPGGFPATEAARVGLAHRNIALGDHTSVKATQHMVGRAHLVLTAEPDHVVWIAGRWPTAFGYTFTLPEAAMLMSRVPAGDGRSWEAWLDAVGSQRPAARRYLERGAVPGVADPTGQAPAAWETMMDEVDRWCGTVSAAVAAVWSGSQQNQDSS